MDTTKEKPVVDRSRHTRYDEKTVMEIECENDESFDSDKLIVRQNAVRKEILEKYPDAENFNLRIQMFSSSVDDDYNSMYDGSVKIFYTYSRLETDGEYNDRIFREQEKLDKWKAAKKAQEKEKRIRKENEHEDRRRQLRELMKDFSVNELKQMVTAEKEYRNSPKR